VITPLFSIATAIAFTTTTKHGNNRSNDAPNDASD